MGRSSSSPRLSDHLPIRNSRLSPQTSLLPPSPSLGGVLPPRASHIIDTILIIRSSNGFIKPRSSRSSCSPQTRAIANGATSQALPSAPLARERRGGTEGAKTMNPSSLSDIGGAMRVVVQSVRSSPYYYWSSQVRGMHALLVNASDMDQCFSLRLFSPSEVQLAKLSSSS